MKNAGKYSLSILVQIAAIVATEQEVEAGIDFWIYVVLSFFSSIYSYSWDIYMDWGLLRTKETGKWGLRHKLMYPVWFYYFAAVTNLFLRFVWIFPLAD